MYRQLAAYAAARIRKPEIFIPAMRPDDRGRFWPVWGIDRNGGFVSSVCNMYQLSILGAMRGAHEVFAVDMHAYTTLDRYARRYAHCFYNKDIKDLLHQETIIVLLAVARL